ncbi:MAG: PAS domain S-box protein [Desmonostoc vinosum HA7617-LM4]|jgi:PAS domain S-box-containing protein|nr:PAS domain S-box protein [Desmonostoc vinosum HA7617-LM4]
MQVVGVREIIERRQIKEALQIKINGRRKQSQALVQLAKSKVFQQSNLNLALREITETAAQILLVERVGVWLYNLEDRSQIECVDLYNTRTEEHTSGKLLLKTNYPTYFQALEEEYSITAHDVRRDIRTQELYQSYLAVLGIKSILNTPIWLEDNLLGVVCYEHVGDTRQWTLAEENFAGSIADFVTLAIEASDRNVTPEVLQQSKEQYQAIFASSSIGIGLIGMQAQIVDVNPALCRILGYSREELQGERFTDYILTQRGDVELYKQLQTGIRDRIEIERRCQHQDGNLVWTRLCVSVILNTNGKPELLLAMVEDINERKQTELKLHASQEAAEAGSRAKTEFLATMSHELRTPLNAIMGLSQLLQQEMIGSLNHKQREYIDCIHNSGEHLLALINDILDLSKVEAGKEELLLSPLSVPNLCNYVIAAVSDRALEKGLKLTSEIDPQADICVADDRRIKQILLNLLTNAIKFTSVGQVSLVTKKVPKGITFTVSDTGIGIDSQQFQFLFEPFKQLDSQLNRQYEGTGLGLALTRKLARLHDGDVTVTSTLGEGSQFTLFLPDPPGLEDSENNPDEEDTSGTSPTVLPPIKRILLVEDEDKIAVVLQCYLQTIGYQVEWINNGNNFLEKLQTIQPSLILVNGQLGGEFNSIHLLNILKQESSFKDLPVVIISSHEPPEDQLSILLDSAKDYLIKPIRIVQLESILMRYLG